MMITKIFLTLTGIIYLILALYCAISPEKASKVVSLNMDGAGGRSEFITVYGGLEFGLAMLCLVPVIFPDYLRAGLWGCLLIHISLVLFRTASLLMEPSAFASVRTFAIGEWIIFLGALIILLTSSDPELKSLSVKPQDFSGK